MEEWPKALAKDFAAYEKQYHAPKIGTDDVVILQCKFFAFALGLVGFYNSNFIFIVKVNQKCYSK